MKRVSSSSTMSPIDTPSTETTLERAFESTDLANLFENEHNRYLKNSAKIGHGLITQDKSLGCEIIRQYNIPISSNPRDPKIRPLQDVEAIERFGMRRYRAHSPDGTRYYATRFIDVAFDDPHGATHRIACFSPPPKNREEPFWTGRTEPTRFWNTDLKEDHNTAFEKEKDTLKTIVKGGEWLKIEPESIRMRNEIKNRNPDQNTVMGESACDAYAAFLDEYQEELDADIRDKFTKAISAPLKDLFKSQTRPEWLHLYGYSLTPMHINPQRQDNLGAAPKWSNTCMMVLERMARWFALNRPHAIIQIRSTFEMLLDSELAKHIDFEVSVEEKGRFLRLFQSIDPFQAFPPFPKASDLAQGTAITYQVLNNIAPISTMPVKHSEFTRHNTSPSLTMNEKTNAEHAMMKPNELNTKKKSTSSTRETKEQLTEEQNTCKKPLLFTKSYQGPAVITSDKKDIPEKSVIKVFSTSQYGDYDSPWTSSSPSKHTGSGFVVEHENQKYIVTNAHVVSDSKRIQVKIANENKKFSAEAIVICYQSDLALLKVSDQEFLNAIQPVVIGDMVRLQDKVRVIGFPMGGSEISVTKGIVSRIEVETYETGNVDMLQVQIDAAINPGNSGGPVFSNGKVVGVAFQGLMFADNLGYIIPAPILKHFLHEVFSSHHYQGFPELPIKIQTLENKHLRELYHMTPDQTGVRIAQIDFLTKTQDLLKKNDILLSIDGHVISNEGTVNVEGIGKRIHFNHLSHMKYIGDTINVTLLRAGKKLKIALPLDAIPHSTKKIAQFEHDKFPTYYFASGILFQPLTANAFQINEVPNYHFANIGFISQCPKKSPTDEFVFINKVLDCEDNEGYNDYTMEIISTINGMPIENIHDVVHAIENYSGAVHTITLLSGEKFAIKNMSTEEHFSLLNHYGIKSDRSDDLLMEQSEKEHLLNEKMALSDLGNESDSSQQESLPQPIQARTKGGQHFLRFLTNLEKRVQGDTMALAEQDEIETDADDENFYAESEAESINEAPSSPILNQFERRYQEQIHSFQQANRDKKHPRDKRQMDSDSDNEAPPVVKKQRHSKR